MKNVNGWLSAVALGSLLASPVAAWANNYPEKSITMVVPYSPGGTTDNVGRILAEKLSQSLGVSVVIENSAGGGSAVGAGKVARARNDGYTLLFTNLAQSLLPSLNDNLNFDPIKDFEPIGLVGELPMMLVARSDYPPADVAELVEHLKANAQNINVGNAGVGSSTHLCALVVFDSLGIDGVTHVPYKGAGPALNDLIGGELDLVCDSPGSSTGHIAAGKLKGYALTSTKRIEAMPDIPTFEEAGYPGTNLTLWHGFYAPRGTPADVIEKLSAALQKAVEDEDFEKRLAVFSIDAESAENARPEPLREKLTSETQRWGELIQRAGVGAGK